MRTREAGLSLVVLLVAAWSPIGAGTVTSVPVPLQDSACGNASNTDSTTAHALYEYQVTAAGAVEGIKLLYSDVQPPERKGVFQSETRTCLSGWRFRPATVDGTPAASLMKVAFHRLPPAPPGSVKVQLPGGHVVTQWFLDQVRSATLTFIETLLPAKNTLQTRGEDWVLRTDLPKSSLDDIQKSLEFARAVFSKVFPGTAGSSSGPRDVTIILFKDEEKYQQVSAFDNLVPERAPVAGQYNSQTRVIYAAQGNKPMPIFARLIAHEATHHFAQLRLAGPDGYVSRWLNEGMAQFVESIKMARPDKIRLEALDRGNVTQSATLMTRDDNLRGEWVWAKTADRSIPVLSENLGQYDLEPLIDGRLDPHFFDNEMEVHYAVSWLLVHALLTADGGRYRAAFEEWAVQPGAGRDAASLGKALGMSMPQLHEMLAKHLKEIR